MWTLLIIAAAIALSIYNKHQKKLKERELETSKPVFEDVGVYWDQKDDDWILVDKTGGKVTEEIFSKVCGFSEGLAAVERLKGKGPSWGYIDYTGKFVIKPKYEDAQDFQKGVAKVKLNEKWILINKAGKEIDR